MINLDKLMYTYNIAVRTMRLTGCRGFAAKNSNGYVIVVNSQLSDEEQIRTTVHELCHIKLGHLDERKHISNEEKEDEVEVQMAEWYL